MDVTETYIKMCKQAIEIQAIANYEREGDWFASPYVRVNYEDFEQGWVCYEGDTWLPQQDQLQEMVEYGQSPPSMIHLFHDFMESEYPSEDITLTEVMFVSWEQLWLAFVMKEKYGKIWDGESWVKEKVEVANA